jgi:hypothetical protein
MKKKERLEAEQGRTFYMKSMTKHVQPHEFHQGNT